MGSAPAKNLEVSPRLYLAWGPDAQKRLKIVDNRSGALSLRIGVTCDNKGWDRQS